LAEVVKVTDGDSIRVKTEFRDFDFPIRLAKINAPELNEGGEESKSWLEKELLGEEVYIKVDKNNRVGKFGRLIGEVLLFGVNINYQSLAEGMSVPFGQEVFR
jgi:endonuclease YncB( thermonuclease family)